MRELGLGIFIKYPTRLTIMILHFQILINTYLVSHLNQAANDVLLWRIFARSSDQPLLPSLPKFRAKDIRKHKPLNLLKQFSFDKLYMFFARQIYVCFHDHTYIHTFIHSEIHTYIHTYIHTHHWFSQMYQEKSHVEDHSLPYDESKPM